MINEELASLKTVKQFIKEYPCWSKGSIRNILFHRKTNGLEASGAVVYNKTKILLDPNKFLNWLKEA